MEAMGRLRKTKKGNALIIVILIVSLVSILGIMVMTMAMQGYKLSKLRSNVDYSSYAVDSAIERVVNDINTPLKNSLDIIYTGHNSFTNSVIERANAKFAPGSNHYDDINVYIDGSPGRISITGGELRVDGVEISHYPYEKNKLIINADILASGGKSHGTFNTRNYNVYAYRVGEAEIPRYFTLNGGAYSVGDILFDNGTDVMIEGDINAYGTCPDTPLKSREYYGGIYAKDGAKVYINGNAYSRGYIRTDHSGTSGSQMYIAKDAVAQSLHIFGNQGKIVVGRNTYTFDDLEIADGLEDSYIAVNGSYFGLSDGTQYDDVSSAMVNNAADTGSRIVVNGDVSILGKHFNGASSSDTVKAWTQRHGYWVKAFNSQDLSYDRVEDWRNSVVVGAWLNNIENDAGLASARISGFAMQLDGIPANGLIYKTIPASEAGSSVERVAFINDKFELDNTYPVLDQRFWKPEAWDDVANGWSNYTGTDSNSMYKKTTYIRDLITPVLNTFAFRRYGDTANSSIENIVEEDPKDIYSYNDPNLTNSKSNRNAGNLFRYMLARFDKIDGSVSSYFVRNYSEADFKIGNGMNMDYYLVVNLNPKSKTIINYDFKGIIVSAGKVEIEKNVIVEGAIIAGGFSQYDDTYTNPQKNAYQKGSFPVVTTDEEKNELLDTGKLAGIHFLNTTTRPLLPAGVDLYHSRSSTKIIFPGRKELLDKFITRSTESNNIYDIASLF